jgi:hypothetical protein
VYCLSEKFGTRVARSLLIFSPSSFKCGNKASGSRSRAFHAVEGDNGTELRVWTTPVGSPCLAFHHHAFPFVSYADIILSLACLSRSHRMQAMVQILGLSIYVSTWHHRLGEPTPSHMIKRSFTSTSYKQAKRPCHRAWKLEWCWVLSDAPTPLIIVLLTCFRMCNI